MSRRETSGRAVGANEVHGGLPTHVSFAAEHVQFEQRPCYHALPELLGEPDRRTAIGRAGRERVLKHFTWRRAAERTLDVYREAIAEHTARAAATPASHASPGMAASLPGTQC